MLLTIHNYLKNCTNQINTSCEDHVQVLTSSNNQRGHIEKLLLNTVVLARSVGVCRCREECGVFDAEEDSTVLKSTEYLIRCTKIFFEVGNHGCNDPEDSLVFY